jgi:hypothetical protein
MRESVILAFEFEHVGSGDVFGTETVEVGWVGHALQSNETH